MSFTPLQSRPRTARRAAPPLPVYAFIAYGELTAARDAIERAKRMLRRTHAAPIIHPMLWRFDQLGEARWREMAMHDAMRAHTIILAMGDAPSLDAGAEVWLTELTNQRGGAPISCLVLMGDDEAWTISLQRKEPGRIDATSGLRKPPPAPRRSCRSLR